MPTPRRPPELRGAVFRKRDALSSGLLTSDALRSSAWRRLFRGVYADAHLPDSVAVRIRGARLALPPSAVFSGRTAAYLHGAVDLADIRHGIDVTVPPDVRLGPVQGMRIRRVALSAHDVTTLGRWRCTTAVRTALDLGRWEPLPDAVAALDVLLARGIVGARDLSESAEAFSARGFRRLRRAVGLADARSESQPESRLRVLLAVAGLHAVPQVVVRDADGDFVARVDLAFPELKIAIEYDGAWHAEPGQFARDRRRLNNLLAAGWSVLHVTAADLRDPVALVARVRALVAAATAAK
jgi:very-short-patch-repair endonuclease